GALSVSATHHGASSTKADGTALGSSTAVGAAIALGFIDDSARASTARNITADGAVSFTARGDGASRSEAKASAAGADKQKESATGKSKADDQTADATTLANSKSGKTDSVGESAS